VGDLATLDPAMRSGARGRVAIGGGEHDTINSLIVLLKQDMHDDANKQIVDRCKFLNQNDTLNLLLDQGINYDAIN